MNEHVREVGIRDAVIRLGQFLKLADLIDQGSEAKEVLARGGVEVNGVPEQRRGRQLVPGDEVALDGQRVRVVVRDAAGEAADDLPW